MLEEYEPRPKEVISEIGRNFGNNFSKESMKKTIRGIKGLSSMILGVNAVLTLSPYAIPSVVRIAKNHFKYKNSDDYVQTPFTIPENIGGTIGFYTGVFMDLGQTVGYIHLALNDHPEALLIPVVTNTISGFYEIGRILYNKTKESIVERNKNDDIESLISS